MTIDSPEHICREISKGVATVLAILGLQKIASQASRATFLFRRVCSQAIWPKIEQIETSTIPAFQKNTKVEKTRNLCFRYGGGALEGRLAKTENEREIDIAG